MEKNKLLLLFFIVTLLFFIFKFTFEFLDIPFYQYGIYLYWMIALVILLNVLPQKTGEIFLK
jgi:hypothetical protein